VTTVTVFSGCESLDNTAALKFFGTVAGQLSVLKITLLLTFLDFVCSKQ
jgi:hypothetical protein